MTNDLNEKRLDKLEERVGQLEVELAELIPKRR
jgi:tetrahydromethanopterin S-methyltransferase subunit G